MFAQMTSGITIMNAVAKNTKLIYRKVARDANKAQRN
jgi:hypothetical protein